MLQLAFGVNVVVVFFFNDTATTEIYTLSLHDALPIYLQRRLRMHRRFIRKQQRFAGLRSEEHTSELQSRVDISYAVFCLKKDQFERIIARAITAPIVSADALVCARR